mgnify:CR=1 FL=1
MRVLETLAKFCAILAGVLLTGITLMTCGSLIGRNTVGVSIVGAFELTGVAAGAAIALFMPLAQVRRGNIIVDFFTAHVSERTNDRLDRFGALLLALIFALLAWRTSLGGINSYSSGSETQIMGFPEWVVYATMVPAFAVGRAQLLLLMVHRLRQQGAIPELPVFLDSPMASRATEIFLRHADELRVGAAAFREALPAGKRPLLIVGTLQDAADALRALKGSGQWRHLVVNCAPNREDWYLDGAKVASGPRAKATKKRIARPYAVNLPDGVSSCRKVGPHLPPPVTGPRI